MNQAIAINGSPRLEKGYTALVLDAFVQGMKDAGAEVETYYTSRLKIKPCTCGQFFCWDETPGECCIHDDMQLLYPKMKTADILVLATPVYVPLPGDMQNFMNRLVPLINPVLVKRDGRTRARFHEDVKIQKIVLVGTGGWWEIENLDTVVRIAREFAEDASIEFTGALLRPHSSAMKSGGEITRAGKTILDAARQAGIELISEGKMHPETLATISQPLVAEEDYQ